jgi:hypothetical protein
MMCLTFTELFIDLKNEAGGAGYDHSDVTGSHQIWMSPSEPIFDFVLELSAGQRRQ